jgi:HK97 family phage major capsid protein/HK97 family phage prohead protease
MPDKPAQPPKDNLVRAVYPSVELRANDDEPSGMPRLVGHFAKFNEWTEIDSLWEGRFMEKIAPGAFKRTFKNNADRIRALFQHGQDPQIGDKPLGPIEVMEEDDQGARYEVPLLDTSYNRDLIPGLEAGLYGSSFRFSVVKEKLDNKPKKSSHNPEGLPERTVEEARVFEFGPVTFPAYAGATAGVRSLTDVYTLQRFVREPQRLAETLESLRAAALPDAGPDVSHSDEGTREGPPPQVETPPIPDPPAGGSLSVRETKPMENMTVEERAARQTEIKSRLAAIDTEYAGSAFPAEVDEEWRQLNEEHDENERVLAQVAERRSRLESIAQKPSAPQMQAGFNVPQVLNRKSTADIYDLSQIRNQARTQQDEVRMLQDNAKRAIEIARFPGAKDRSKAQTYAEWVLDNVVEDEGQEGKLARRILVTGSPLYDRAFGKAITQKPLDNEEARALSLSASAGGNAVTFDLDPTIMGTSNRTVNPLRGIARVIPITGDEWRGVTSGAITTAYAAEATETTDNAPTLTQPAISTEKAQAFIPFSIEIGMDWAGLRGEMSTLLQESKDDLEASKFATGTGTNEPFGVITGATTTITATTPQTFDAEDLYRLAAALPPRHQPRASVLANRAIYHLVRQFVLTGQSNPWKDLEEGTSDATGRVGTLLGYPAYELSTMDATAATNNEFMILGDFSRFVIVDRVGLDIELIPHLFGANQRPTGQRGLYAFWRNGSKVVDANAFRVLLGIV